MITIDIDIDKYGLSQHIEEAVIEYAKDELVRAVEKEGWVHVVQAEFKKWKDNLLRQEITSRIEAEISQVDWGKLVGDAINNYIEAAIPQKVAQQLEQYVEAKAREVWS